MKLRVAALLAMLCVSSTAWAGPVSFGVKGGLTQASLNIDEIDTENRTGWAAGGFAEYPLSNKFALQGEVLYVSRGTSFGKSDIRGPGGEDLGEIETFLVRDDLDIGLRGKLNLGQGPKLRPYLLLGPALSIEMNEKATTDPSSTLFPSVSTDILENVAVGITFGAGTEIALGAGHLLLEANYDLGITDLSEASVGSDIHAATWRFMTGYHF